jgi:hypothetical protein
MKEQHIKALKIAPMERPEICYLENKLESLQKAVSIGADYVGLIEIIDLDERTCIVCNEEGKLINLMPNRRIGDDIICGVFYVTGQNDEGDLTSLTDEQIEHYSEVFCNIEYFMQSDDGKIIVLRFI